MPSKTTVFIVTRFLQDTAGVIAFALPLFAYAAADCPLPDASKHWDIACAQAVMKEQATVPFTVVERTWRGTWQQSCEPPKQNLATATSWTSCPPPPACSADEEVLKRRNGQARLELWKQRCLGKKVTMLPDDDPHCSVPLQNVHSIVVHQTEAGESYGPNKVQGAHLNRGFDDIGYHYVAKTDGGWRVFQGRSESVEGAHAGAGLNAGSISIAMAGDYRAESNPGKDPSTLVPPLAAVLLLKSLILDIKARHPGVSGVYGHGEYKLKGSGCDTDCPSLGIQQLVNALRGKYFGPPAKP